MNALGRIVFRDSQIFLYAALILSPMQVFAEDLLGLDPPKPELYKCKDPGGKIYYTDKKCSKGYRSTSKGWVSVDQEEKQKRIEMEKKRELARAVAAQQAKGDSPQTNNVKSNYHDLPESTRYYNPNTDQVCFDLVKKLRILENSSYYDTREGGREWSRRQEQIMVMGCKS